MRGLLKLLLSISLLVVTAGCAPRPAATSGDSPSPTTVAKPAPPAATAPVQAPIPNNPLDRPVQPRPISNDPTAVNRSCKTDADCTVKDLGNCCGYYPACVNVDAKTDPKAVQAQCAKTGMASVCGFPEISGCQCVKGQCAADTQASAL